MSSENEKIASEQTPHLTEAYQKARRSLSLASGILLAWEYVGVQISTSTAELPVAKTPVSLLNPEVLPQVIFVIVLYFAGRVTIEWFQCDKSRRKQIASRLDFSLAITLSLLALLLFIFQNFSGIRLASLAELSQSLFFSGILFSASSFYAYTFMSRNSKSKVLIIAIFFFLLFIIAFNLILGYFVSFVAGVFLTFIILLARSAWDSMK